MEDRYGLAYGTQTEKLKPEFKVTELPDIELVDFDDAMSAAAYAPRLWEAADRLGVSADLRRDTADSYRCRLLAREWLRRVELRLPRKPACYARIIAEPFTYLHRLAYIRPVDPHLLRRYLILS